MSAYAPVPAAPERTGWEHLERFLIDARPNAEWQVPPTLETLGQLTMLRADLRSDLECLIGIGAQRTT